MTRDKQTEEDDGVSRKLLGFLLLGMILIFVGITVLAVASLMLGGSGSVGGVILIGPIPIIFGSGPDAAWLIMLGVIASVISIVAFIVLNRKIRREEN